MHVENGTVNEIKVVNRSEKKRTKVASDRNNNQKKRNTKKKAEGAILVPKMTLEARRELNAAQLFVENDKTRQYENDDQDISMVAEYSDEIFEHLRSREEELKPTAFYVEGQSECYWDARSALMNWLVMVHDDCNLVHEILFLAVNYFDRYLSCSKDKHPNLKLIGATCLFLATKYEDDNLDPGGLENFKEYLVESADGTFTADELLKAELHMLEKLEYALGWPDPMSFLRRISSAADFKSGPGALSKYFLYITVVDKHFVGCVPSFLSAGIYCLRRFMLGKGQWVFLRVLLVVGRLTEYSRNATYITLVTH
jgi:hypothetical protein